MDIFTQFQGNCVQAKLRSKTPALTNLNALHQNRDKPSWVQQKKKNQDLDGQSLR
jgi:hypothetical protein